MKYRDNSHVVFSLPFPKSQSPSVTFYLLLRMIICYLCFRSREHVHWFAYYMILLLFERPFWSDAFYVLLSLSAHIVFNWKNEIQALVSISFHLFMNIIHWLVKVFLKFMNHHTSNTSENNLEIKWKGIII